MAILKKEKGKNYDRSGREIVQRTGSDIDVSRQQNSTETIDSYFRNAAENWVAQREVYCGGQPNDR